MAEPTVTRSDSNSELPASASEARELGYKRFYDGKPCKHGHVSERLANNSRCLICHRNATRLDKQNNPERERAYRQRTAEKQKESAREWVRKNPERRREICSRSNKKNIEKRLEYNRQWRAANPDLQKRTERRYYENNREERAEATRRYKRKNRALFAAKQRERQADKRQATPFWADRSAILAYYEQAQTLTEVTGDQYTVDHIVPLRSDLVCGMHVESNLQVMLYSENYSKGNRWWPDMPDEEMEKESA